MQNINPEDLDRVCGGTGTTTSPPVTPTNGSSPKACTGNNDALMTSLNSISSSIKDLSSKNNNQGLFGGNGMLLFGMAMAMRRNDSTVVVNGGGGCGHGSYSWHARW